MMHRRTALQPSRYLSEPTTSAGENALRFRFMFLVASVGVVGSDEDEGAN